MINNFYRPPRINTRIAAVDLDGTLAWPTWKPGQPRSVVGDPIPENIEKLLNLKKVGYEIVIHTSRHWSDEPMIEAWLIHNRIPFNKIVCGKYLADLYIDDKAVQARDEKWL